MHTFKGNEIRKKLVAMECHRRFWKVFKKLGMISVPCSESSRTDPYSTFIHSPLRLGATSRQKLLTRLGLALELGPSRSGRTGFGTCSARDVARLVIDVIDRVSTDELGFDWPLETAVVDLLDNDHVAAIFCSE